MLCMHCNKKIKHFHDKLWHDDGLIFPQYCSTSYDSLGNILPAKLHKPRTKLVNKKEKNVKI